MNYQEIAEKAVNIYKANQDILPLAQLLMLLYPMNPKVIVDIGSCWGGTAYAFSQLLPTKGKVFTIDIDNKIYPNVLEDDRIEFIQGSSHSPEILDYIKADLAGEKIDIVFIDGDHSYEGVKKDFEFYYPLVRKNGCICFHDLATTAFPEPGQFWNDLIIGKIAQEHPETAYDSFMEIFIHRNPDKNNPEEIWKKNIGIVFKGIN